MALNRSVWECDRKNIIGTTLLIAVIAWIQLGCSGIEAGSAPPWTFGASGQNADLEREAIPLSPAQVGRRYASQLFNGRQLETNSEERDMFQCVEPSRPLFENFMRQYNRSFYGDSSEELNRLNLFSTTLKRIITLNRVIQNEVTNQSNYNTKAEYIRNYHFISPTGAQIVAPWYADITDCELGLIKYIIFDIFYLIERNELAMAYKAALDNNEYLPLLNADGFEQLATILLVRLYDRFKGEERMNKLFQWPLYVKKLAGYAYNRRQISDPAFKSKLPLVAFAYPPYFKDLKYNAPAANRSSDNVRAHQDHERFNKVHGRRFANAQERNKRLVIFRQRWSLINLLNEDKGAWQNATGLQPEWQRAQQPAVAQSGSFSEKLRDDSHPSDDDWNPKETNQKHSFKHTQFSDLTDAEFVAYLTNDFSLLENNEEAATFIDNNFPICRLDAKYRAELAAELELRRALLAPTTLEHAAEQVETSTANGVSALNSERKSLTLAKQVIDELISDVGLPVGAVAVERIPEGEYFSVFNRVAEFFRKPYTGARTAGSVGRFGEPDSAELADEKQVRYQQFKLNYGRFKAYFIKEGLQLDENQLVAMLRLADLSWRELKLILFKVCCLASDNRQMLSARNATIQYWSSNSFMCQQMTTDGSASQATNTNRAGLDPQLQNELTALELYYYYSVHFNKHHVDSNSFDRRFAIFRHNIDQIGRHSCTRALSLFEGLRLKRSELLNTIDVLDPRRSYTDDINLDRYKYFTVPDLSNDNKQHWTDASDNLSSRLRSEANSEVIGSTGNSLSLSRAGISYRRDAFFASLMEQPQRRADEQQQYSTLSHADRLFNLASDNQLAIEKYRRNGVSRIYELVMERYRYCMRTLRNIELTPIQLRRHRCQSTGPLADHAISSWSDNQISSAAARLQLQQEDQCAFYWLGLEPWKEGLIEQEPRSAQLIDIARC